MKKALRIKNRQFSWLFKMAWRDAKASKVRLLLFMASIILGISALVSIQLFSTNLKNTIKSQSKTLMGADFIIDSKQEPTTRAKEIIDSLQPNAYEVNFVSMVAFPKNGSTKLVKVRGLAGDFPFYGELNTVPISAAKEYQEMGGALVDATLLLQFNAKVGDAIKIGEITLPIAGALKSIPGSSAITNAAAPPVLIPFRFIEATELIQFGSRKEYQYFYKAPDTLNLNLLENKLGTVLAAENADLDTHTSTTKRLGRRYENVSKFLSLVAFIALLLGCIGIASAVHIYIKEKIQAVAILKCVGASRLQSFLIYLIQIAGIGIVGGLIGALIGVGLQVLFPYLVQEFLPFTMDITISLQPIFLGIFLGLFMAVLFALSPLLKTWYVSPLAVLRIDEKSTKTPKKIQFVVYGIILLVLFLFAFWLIQNAIYALIFILFSFITFTLLGLVALVFIKLIKHYFPKNWSFTARQSLLNLFRPNNQTVVLVVAIGLGTFLISTLYFTKDILGSKATLKKSLENPNIIILDVQRHQKEQVVKSITTKNLPVLNNIPLVTMRMHSIKGKFVNDIRQDSVPTIRRWILNHEFRTTYRDSLTASEELIKGTWISKVEEGEPILISISSNLASDANVSIGDKIVFNVQGVLMETTIGSIREVDWTQIQLNFSIVFPAGVLELAPQFNVLTTAVTDEISSANLQRDLVAKFPNVTIIDLRQVFTLIENILDKVSWVINFMAFFSILTGIIVLIGSVRNSKYQRIKESVLLRTLGAKNKQILQIATFEYLFLGILGSLVGVFLALISSSILAIFVFKEPFIPSIIPFAVFLPAIIFLVMLIGVSNIQSVLKSAPLEVLRKEI